MMVYYKHYRMYSILTLIIFLLSAFATPGISQTDTEIELVDHFGGFIGNFDIKDDYAYLCQGTVLTVLDISASEFVEVAWMLLPDEPADFVIAGDFAFMYIGAGDSALRILDISNPFQPHLLGSMALRGAWRGKIAVSNEYAYIAMDESLKVVHISDPFSLNVVQTIDVPANDVFVADDVVYVGGFDGLTIFDATAPDNLIETGHFSAEQVHGIYVEDSLAYLAGSRNEIPGAGLTVVDVSDVSAPAQLAHFSTNIDNHCYVPDAVEVADNHAYIAANEMLFIVDVTDPANPVWVSSVRINRGAYPGIESQRLVPPYLYIATGESSWGFRKINVSDPASPQTESMLEEGWDMQHLYAYGTTLYVSSWERLWIYDYNDPENPQLLGSDTTWTQLSRICKHQNMIFGLSNQTMFVIDVADPGNMYQVGRLDFEEGSLRDIKVEGTYAYLITVGLPNYSSQLVIVDISNPSAPAKTGEFTLAGEGRDLFIQDESKLAFVSFHADESNKGFQIINVSVPAAPALLGTAQTAGRPSCTWVADSLVWIGSNTTLDTSLWHLESFDIAGDVTAPARLNETSGDGWICDIEVHNDYLIASLPTNSVFIFNPITLDFLAKCASPNSLFFTTMYFPLRWAYYIYTINGYLNPDKLKASASWGAIIAKLKAIRKVAKIKISPPDTSVAKEQTVKFVATSMDSIGEVITANIKWSASGGTIDSTGKYTATTEGDYTVTATDISSGVSGSATIHVTATAVECVARSVTDFKLAQNYPNPFNPTTCIAFSVKENCHVRLRVFDIQGREVTTLTDSYHKTGQYKYLFDARMLTSGVYFYEIQMQDFHEIKKMILLQ